MTAHEVQFNSPWLDGVKHRLVDLCNKFAAQVNEYDTTPNRAQITTTFKFLQSVHASEAPVVDITTDANITLLWKSGNDKLKVYVQPGNEILCFQNKKRIDVREFSRLVECVPA